MNQAFAEKLSNYMTMTPDEVKAEREEDEAATALNIVLKIFNSSVDQFRGMSTYQMNRMREFLLTGRHSIMSAYRGAMNAG